MQSSTYDFNYYSNYLREYDNQTLSKTIFTNNPIHEKQGQLYQYVFQSFWEIFSSSNLQDCRGFEITFS